MKIIGNTLLLVAMTAIISCSNEAGYDAQGTFEATEITLSSEVSGKILDFCASEGDKICAGDTIAIIDTVQLYLRKLQLEKQGASVLKNRPDVNKQIDALQKRLEKAEREKLRLENLIADGAATSKQLDDADAAIVELRSRIEAERQTLSNSASSIDENASMIDVQIAMVEDMLRKSVITSPIDCQVLAKYAEAGEFAAAGRPILKIADTDKLFLRAYFTSEQLADIKIGQEVDVKADFGGDRQYSYKGKIVWISDESEFTPKTIQTKDSRSNLVYAVKIGVENDGRLKIGLAAEVSL